MNLYNNQLAEHVFPFELMTAPWLQTKMLCLNEVFLFFLSKRILRQEIYIFFSFCFFILKEQILFVYQMRNRKCCCLNLYKIIYFMFYKTKQIKINPNLKLVSIYV